MTRKDAPKRKEFGKRIEKLRKSLGYDRNQSGFAELVKHGLRQGTVSAWEKGRDRKPSAEMFLRLAILAKDPTDREFFLEQAGVTPALILEVADQITRRRNPVLVDAYPGTENRGQFLIDGNLIPNPNLFYFVLDEKSSQLVFAPVDVLLIEADVGGEDGKELKSLWNEIVLVWLRESYAPKDLPTGLRPGQFLAGVLRLTSNSPYDRWTAHLDPILQERSHLGIDIGFWNNPKANDPFAALPPESESRSSVRTAYQSELAVNLESRAAETIRAIQEVDVIGRVVGWFANPNRGNPNAGPEKRCTPLQKGNKEE
jgi:transcriptional regulator with XRE-family HTH domain